MEIKQVYQFVNDAVGEVIGDTALVAEDLDIDDVTGLHITHGDHLGQADGFLVKLYPVPDHIVIVPLGQIQVHAQKSILLHRVGVADLRIFCTAGIGAVAAGIPVGNGHILAGDLQGAAGEGVPHIPGNARCGGRYAIGNGRTRPEY